MQQSEKMQKCIWAGGRRIKHPKRKKNQIKHIKLPYVLTHAVSVIFWTISLIIKNWNYYTCLAIKSFYIAWYYTNTSYQCQQPKYTWIYKKYFTDSNLILFLLILTNIWTESSVSTTSLIPNSVVDLLNNSTFCVSIK